jgi:putative transposase
LAGARTRVPKGGSSKRTAVEKRAYVRDHRPPGLSVAEGCRPIGIARSTYYDAPRRKLDDTALVEAMSTICDAFEAYGWRRVQAALRQQGVIANHKKIKRLMREHDLQPRRRRRFVATTDSRHDGPIFPNRAREVALTGPNQLWIADITYVPVTGRFAYVAIVLDAWSRAVVGYAISRSIDARLTVAALEAAIERRRPQAGCVHHSDRGSQYVAQAYRDILTAHGLIGSMGRRGNPYDNAKAGELHEDAQGRGGLSDGLRDLRRRRREPSGLHRRHLQREEAFTRHSAISARANSRITTPGRWSKPQPDRCPPQGVHSKTGDEAGNISGETLHLDESLAPTVHRCAYFKILHHALFRFGSGGA